MFFHLADVKGFLRRHTDPDIRRLFLASVRQLKSFCLFDVVPTAEQLNALRPIERSILEEIWEILPATAIESPSVATPPWQTPFHYFLHIVAYHSSMKCTATQCLLPSRSGPVTYNVMRCLTLRPYVPKSLPSLTMMRQGACRGTSIGARWWI